MDSYIDTIAQSIKSKTPIQDFKNKMNEIVNSKKPNKNEILKEISTYKYSFQLAKEQSFNLISSINIWSYFLTNDKELNLIYRTMLSNQNILNDLNYQKMVLIYLNNYIFYLIKRFK